MRLLTYVLRFHRAPKTPEHAEPRAVATSLQLQTLIANDSVTANLTTLPGSQAELETQFRLDKSGQLFFEWGEIKFGATTSLQYSSIGAGVLLGAPDSNGFSHGVVMWKIDGGTGTFAGATGAITSNFLVNLRTDELIDNQLHVLYLP